MSDDLLPRVQDPQVSDGTSRVNWDQDAGPHLGIKLPDGKDVKWSSGDIDEVG